MNKLFKSLLLCLCTISLFACENTNEETTKQLATPNFSCVVDDNNITVAWEAVDYAAYYTIALNDEEPINTDLLAHRFEGLRWGQEYTITLTAISADKAARKDSEPGVKSVTIAERVVPQYREWSCPPAQAISNNGRWICGGFDHMGSLIDLETDEAIILESMELYDISDDGIGVGCTFAESMDGEAALYMNGEIVKIDLSSLTSSNMSNLTGITPDGEYVVGWWWEYDQSSYYALTYGMIVPFCYDIKKDRLSIPELGETIYYIDAISLQSVSPDRRILGTEQSSGFSTVILFEDEYSGHSYLDFQFDSEYNPTSSFGDLQTRFSPNGNFVCGIQKSYSGEMETQQPAIYNCTTGEVITFVGIGSVTAVTDDGIAFLNDTPYYLGTTSFVVDTNVDINTQTPLAEYLESTYQMDLHDYILDGIIISGVSADGSILVGITNTLERGWVTFAIDLNGVAM